MSDTALPDRDARRTATTVFDRNLVVEAGAGTGKTSLLVERLLVALGAGLVDAAGFAAITFTEKAAAEMRDRLAAGLEELRAFARGAAPRPEKASGRAFAHLTGERAVAPADLERRSLSALVNLDRAAVLTIHSFCSDLLRSHPVEAGVDPAFRVDEGPLYAALLEEAWEEFLRVELGPGAARGEIWKRLLSAADTGAVREAALALARFDVPASLLRGARTGEDARPALRAEALRRIAAIDSVVTRQKGMTRNALGKLGEYKKALALFSDRGPDALRDAIRSDEDLREALRKAPPKRNAALSVVAPEELEGVARDARRLAGLLATIDDRLAEILLEAAAPFALDARRRLLAGGAVSFDALLSLARDLLRDRPAVREEARRRYRMLLVDEFQDTDPLQYEIVLYLAGRVGEREKDAYAVPLEPGRLFIVGDPKQSIYRFRGADYAAFRRAVDRVVAEGGLELDLVANFRSVPAILGPVNDLFRGSWRASPRQPGYVPIEPVRADAPPSPRVEVWTVESRNAVERRDLEGALVAERIRHLVETEGYERRDVFVLLRAFTVVHQYARPLRDAGIPFVVDGGRLFLDRPEVRHLMAVLRALARPSDPVALLAYLRSPAGAVPDTELAAHAAAGGSWKLREEVDAERLPALARALAGLRALRDETADLPADAVVRRAMARTGSLVLGGFAHEGAQRVANLGKLAAAAAQLARDGRLSLNDVLDEIENERASDVEGDSPLADERVNAVRVLTVHKAKGLESKVVFVVDLARRDAHGGRSLRPVEVADLPGRGKALGLAVGGVFGSARALRDLEEEEHEAAERLRLLYVAATRARERLILLTGAGEKSAWAGALAPWGYSVADPPADGRTIAEGRVLHRVSTAGWKAPEEPRGAVREPAEAVESFRAAVRRYEEAARPPLRRPSGPPESLDGAREASEDAGASGEARDRDVGRAAGIATHEILERWSPVAGPVPEPLVRSAAARAARETSAEPEAVERELREVLAAFASSSLAQKLASVEVIGREVPVLLRHGDGTASSGILDLLYREADGTVVVADFKTDRSLSPDEARERYGPQLSVYAEAVGRSLGLGSVPRAELWLLRSGALVAAG